MPIRLTPGAPSAPRFDRTRGSPGGPGVPAGSAGAVPGGPPLPSAAVAASSASWRRFIDPAHRPEAHVVGFRTADQRGPGHVDFEWEGPGDTIRFEMTVE